MKSKPFSTLITALSLLGIIATGYARTNTPEFAPSSTPPTTTAEPGITAAEPTIVPRAVASTPEVAAADWADIKDFSYDLRKSFFAGFARLEAKVDAQMNELTTRRAAMTSLSNPKDWDFAMKEMINARAYFVSMGKELESASVETWSQQKEKVGHAWTRSQDAYTAVKSSITN